MTHRIKCLYLHRRAFVFGGVHWTLAIVSKCVCNSSRSPLSILYHSRRSKVNDIYSPLCTSITLSFFHSRLKTYLFHKSYPRSFTSSSRTASTDFCLHRFFWATRFLFYFFVIFRFWAVRYIKLAISSAFERTLIYRIVSYICHCTDCCKRLLFSKFSTSEMSE